MQGKHRAAGHLTRSADHANVAVQSSHIAQTSITFQANRAALTSHMAQDSTEAKVSSIAQTSACSALYCSISGTMQRMLILATSSSSLTAAGKCGGAVTSAQMAVLMSGKQLCIGPVAHPAPSVQTGGCVSTTHWPPSILAWLQSRVARMRAQLTTTQLPATWRCSGNANMDMSTLLESTVGQSKTMAVLSVLLLAIHHCPSNNILF